MRLTTLQIAHAERQLQAAAIAETASIVERLRAVFGNHTFLVDPDGLNILESFDEDQSEGAPEALTAIQLAAWTDDTRQSLATHQPFKTDKLVVIGGVRRDAPARARAPL